jgi:branched-chain amino acid transport system ATP-binding protein
MEFSQSSSVIVIDNISKQFGGVNALDHCSFRIEAGRITGLIGPNGAGKTTLFNIIAGFIRPNSGRIWLDGEDVTGLPPHQLFQRGLVRTFQIPREFGRMTVLENLMVVPPHQAGENLFNAWFRWRRVQRQERQLQARAEEVLERLNLIHLRDQLAVNLSGGQKKLLELGRTLMTDARVILLDEPGAGVNRTLLADLIRFIEYLNRERGCTFCIIEHDLDLVTRLCHHVVVMAGGRVLTQGPMQEIRQNPAVREAYLGSIALADALSSEPASTLSPEGSPP